MTIATRWVVPLALLLFAGQAAGSTEDDIFGPEVEDALKRALSSIPDAAGIQKIRTETRRDFYQQLTGGDTPPSSFRSDSISGTFQSGNTETSKNGIKTKISWVTNSCICLDFDCLTTGLIDHRVFGHFQDGELRDTSPLLFFNTTSGTPLPCLSITTMNYTDMTIEGCKVVSSSRDGLHVRNCLDDNIENLRLYDKVSGALVARPLLGSEILPDNAIVEQGFSQKSLSEEAADVLVLNGLETLDFSIEFEVFGIEFSFPFSLSVGDQIQEAANIFLTSAFNGLAETLRPQDFDSTNPGSDAPFADLLRIFLRFDITRLVDASSDSAAKADDGLGNSVLVREVTAELPETSLIQEIISGIVLLFLTSCFLGSTAARVFIREARGNKRLSNLILRCLASAFAVGAEATAYALRWKDEKEKEGFVRSVSVVDLVGGGRFGGVNFLRIGQDFDPFVVTIYNVEVVDDSSNRQGIFIVGVLAAFLGLVLSFFATVCQPDEDQPPPHQSRHAAGNTTKK